jgi:hypothetical protein
MRIILAVILAMMVGCAATVPQKDYDELKATFFKVSADKEECVQKWKPSDVEVDTGLQLMSRIQLFVEEFAKYMSESVGEKVEVKADDIGFIDNHNGALVRVWVSFPDALAKYYLLFARTEDGDWVYRGYFKAGVVQH